MALINRVVQQNQKSRSFNHRKRKLLKDLEKHPEELRFMNRKTLGISVTQISQLITRPMTIRTLMGVFNAKTDEELKALYRQLDMDPEGFNTISSVHMVMLHMYLTKQSRFMLNGNSEVSRYKVSTDPEDKEYAVYPDYSLRARTIFRFPGKYYPLVGLLLHRYHEKDPAEKRRVLIAFMSTFSNSLHRSDYKLSELFYNEMAIRKMHRFSDYVKVSKWMIFQLLDRIRILARHEFPTKREDIAIALRGGQTRRNRVFKELGICLPEFEMTTPLGSTILGELRLFRS